MRLVVLFGGRSAEHEVSCVSARHVLAAADPDKYEIEPIAITKRGRWVRATEAAEALKTRAQELPPSLPAAGPAVDPIPLLEAASPSQGQNLDQATGAPITVVFPVLHGPNGEDGTIQGMLELADVPYVGAGVLASALCMDKSMANTMLTAAGIPHARWRAVTLTDPDRATPGSPTGDASAEPTSATTPAGSAYTTPQPTSDIIAQSTGGIAATATNNTTSETEGLATPGAGAGVVPPGAVGGGFSEGDIAAQVVAEAERAVEDFGLPLFVKPANMGSSVGVTKARDLPEVIEAINLALRYDHTVLFEENVNGREIEVAVLGNQHPEASVPGEIVPGADFYDYNDKYQDGAQLIIPAELEHHEAEAAQKMATDAFRALGVEGLARVDFFYEDGRQGRGNRGWMVNELNTMPGFTPISMYPRLWQASGLAYSDLIDRLVQLALERHQRRQRHTHTER